MKIKYLIFAGVIVIGSVRECTAYCSPGLLNCATTFDTRKSSAENKDGMKLNPVYRAICKLLQSYADCLDPFFAKCDANDHQLKSATSQFNTAMNKFQGEPYNCKISGPDTKTRNARAGHSRVTRQAHSKCEQCQSFEKVFCKRAQEELDCLRKFGNDCSAIYEGRSKLAKKEGCKIKVAWSTGQENINKGFGGKGFFEKGPVCLIRCQYENPLPTNVEPSAAFCPTLQKKLDCTIACRSGHLTPGIKEFMKDFQGEPFYCKFTQSGAAFTGPGIIILVVTVVVDIFLR